MTTQPTTINNQSGLFPLPVQTGDAGSADSTPTADGAGSSPSVTNPGSIVGLGNPGLILNSQGQFASDSSDTDGSPELPNVSGNLASGGAAQSPVASWLTIPPGSLSQALGMLSDIAADNMMTMQQIRTEAAKNEYTTQQEAADAQVAQVQGERSSAWTKFAGSLTAGAVSFGFGLAGGRMLSKGDPEKIVMGSVYQALGTTTGQIINSGTDLLDKTEGGQYKADQAKIAKAYLDMLVSIFKSEDEGFNTEVQNAQKSLQNVWDLKRAVADQDSQAIILAATNG